MPLSLATLIVVSLAAVLSWAITRGLVRHAPSWVPLDEPNARSLHDVPTPRGGGVAIVLAVIASGTVWSSFTTGPVTLWIALTPGVLLIGIVSLIDDVSGVRARIRFAVQCTAALLLVAGDITLRRVQIDQHLVLLPPGVASVVTVVFIVWMTNLYNFMDGMDGLASSMAVIGFGTFGILGWLAGQPTFGALAAIIAAASGGFLVFNVPPARIFLGDVGSSTLGFLAAALTLWGVQVGVFSIFVGILVFSPFIVDATITLLRRTAKGEHFWTPHRTHVYQRLARGGLGHRRTLIVEIGFMFACSLAAIVLADAGPPFELLMAAFFAATYAILFVSAGRVPATPA